MPRASVLRNSRSRGHKGSRSSVRSWPLRSAALLDRLYALSLVLTYTHTPCFSNRYLNTSKVCHPPSLHSSLVVGRQPLPWSPSLLSQPRWFWPQAEPVAMPIIDAIISATDNTKSLCLISATSFPHASLVTMATNNKAVKGAGCLYSLD